jgi:hypothetical protein
MGCSDDPPAQIGLIVTSARSVAGEWKVGVDSILVLLFM